MSQLRCPAAEGIDWSQTAGFAAQNLRSLTNRRTSESGPRERPPCPASRRWRTLTCRCPRASGDHRLSRWSARCSPEGGGCPVPCAGRWRGIAVFPSVRVWNPSARVRTLEVPRDPMRGVCEGERWPCHLWPWRPPRRGGAPRCDARCPRSRASFRVPISGVEPAPALLSSTSGAPHPPRPAERRTLLDQRSAAPFSTSGRATPCSSSGDRRGSGLGQPGRRLARLRGVDVVTGVHRCLPHPGPAD